MATSTSAAAFIDPAPPLDPGLDYGVLRTEGTKLLQQLAGSVWTDYNEHDPGVTTLEQLCYALTELSYRADLPLEDLLVSPRTGRIDPRRQALFVPRRILPVSPVTADDYRKLVVDRVPAVRNAWFVPRSGPPGSTGGLYDALVYAPGCCECPSESAEPDTGSPGHVRDEVRRVYSRHRGLCEDLEDVVILGTPAVVVGADVALDATRAPEEVLADIFFHLQQLFAPELRRSPLEELVRAGLPPSRIFDGPLLVNGFIADSQLQPKAREVPVAEVVRAVVRRKGVCGASRVRVTDPSTGRTYRRNQRVPVPERDLLHVDSRPDPRTGAYSIRLTRNGVPCDPDPRRVQRELDRLRADWRRTYPLEAQYEEYFAFPEGRRRDLASYDSVQNQYPNVYGISAFGLPAEASAARRGAARQLKGYLLAFEQLLADYFSQLAHVRDLFSTDRRVAQTYFWQYLDRSVPDVVPLLKRHDGSYHDGLPRLVREMDPVVERRNRFLQFLLALYGESLDPGQIVGATSGQGPDQETEGRLLLAARLALLRRLVTATHDRGRGADVRAAPSLRNTAGLVLRSRIQLGMDPLEHRPLADLLDEEAVDLVESEEVATAGRPLARHADHIRERFADAASAGVIRRSGSHPGTGLLRGHSVTEAFLRAGADRERYRLGRLPGEAETTVVCRAGPADEWRLVGKYADENSAAVAVEAFAALLGRLRGRAQQLYVVEHTLLRFAGSGPDDGAERRTFGYSFAVTAVISGAPGRDDDPGYRRFARQVLRENTPAHVAVETVFLGAHRMRRFETLYWSWRDALRDGDPRERAEASRRLQSFLERQEDGQPGDPRSLG